MQSFTWRAAVVIALTILPIGSSCSIKPSFDGLQQPGL
jgi:hypothetical protein